MAGVYQSTEFSRLFWFSSVLFFVGKPSACRDITNFGLIFIRFRYFLSFFRLLWFAFFLIFNFKLLSLYNTYHSKYSIAIYVKFLLKLSSEPNKSRQSGEFCRTDFFLWIGQKRCAAASFVNAIWKIKTTKCT